MEGQAVQPGSEEEKDRFYEELASVWHSYDTLTWHHSAFSFSDNKLHGWRDSGYSQPQKKHIYFFQTKRFWITPLWTVWRDTYTFGSNYGKGPSPLGQLLRPWGEEMEADVSSIVNLMLGLRLPEGLVAIQTEGMIMLESRWSCLSPHGLGYWGPAIWAVGGMHFQKDSIS